jgi:hypothetical protein
MGMRRNELFSGEATLEGFSSEEVNVQVENRLPTMPKGIDHRSKASGK